MGAIVRFIAAVIDDVARCCRTHPSSFIMLSPLVNTPDLIDGASLVALSLSRFGVRRVFGIVGVPVIEIGIAVQMTSKTDKPVKYYGFRNEQSCSYAASVCGYIDGFPSVCLSVPGPGLVHTLAGAANAWSNAWPMVIIGGGIISKQETMGGFQESPALAMFAPYCKFVHRVSSLLTLAAMVEKAIRIAAAGRPGPTMIEIPAELINKTISPKQIVWRPAPPPAPRPSMSSSSCSLIVGALLGAQRPLVIAGKGAAYSRAEEELREFISRSGIPYLLTPMGKGVLPDSSPLHCGAARSLALAKADVVLIMGARLNWQLHFGSQQRFNPAGRLIHIDIQAEELGNHSSPLPALLVQADIKTATAHINEHIKTQNTIFPAYAEWKSMLAADIAKNEKTVRALLLGNPYPLTYYCVYRELSVLFSNNANYCIVNEGANTMDIGRTMLLHTEPRLRLDAGTFAAMGLGCGYAIAASVCYPDKRVVCIQGDSAFGFSGMEYETAVRYRLPIIFMVFNNSGIYEGSPVPTQTVADPLALPVTSLTTNSQYEKFADVFGGLGMRIERFEDIKPVMDKALAHVSWPCIINVLLDKGGKRRESSHGIFPTSSL